MKTFELLSFKSHYNLNDTVACSCYLGIKVNILFFHPKYKTSVRRTLCHLFSYI